MLHTWKWCRSGPVDPVDSKHRTQTTLLITVLHGILEKVEWDL